METFAQVGIDFLAKMSMCHLFGWKSARGAAFYFHGEDGVSVFMRGLKTGRCLAGDALKAYGVDPNEMRQIIFRASGLDAIFSRMMKTGSEVVYA